MKKYLKPVLVLAIACALLLVCSVGLSGVKAARAEQFRNSVFESMLPRGGAIEEVLYDGDDENIRAVYKNYDGYIVETTLRGYSSDITMWTAVGLNGSVKDFRIVDMNETHTLGRRALNSSSFVTQFWGSRGGLVVGENVDALSGATLTSRAVANAINSACAYVTGSDVVTSATK